MWVNYRDWKFLISRCACIDLWKFWMYLPVSPSLVLISRSGLAASRILTISAWFLSSALCRHVLPTFWKGKIIPVFNGLYIWKNWTKAVEGLGTRFARYPLMKYHVSFMTFYQIQGFASLCLLQSLVILGNKKLHFLQSRFFSH